LGGRVIGFWGLDPSDQWQWLDVFGRFTAAEINHLERVIERERVSR